MLLIHERYNFVRLLIGLLVSSIFLFSLLSLRPYVREEDNLLAILSQLILVILFFTAILLKVFIDITVCSPRRDPLQPNARLQTCPS